MSTIKKLPSGKWQAQVARLGIRASKAFNSKREASDWASRQEYLITDGEVGEPSKMTLATAFQKYADEVSIKHKGERWEVIRLQKLSTYNFANKPLSKLKPKDIAAWRDLRLQEVSSASVAREMNLIEVVLVFRPLFSLVKVDQGFISGC